jgi:hypothetical protein
VRSRNEGEADPAGLRGEYERLAGELVAGRRVGREVLTAFLSGAARAHEEMGDDERYALRYGLGRDFRLRFRDYRDVGALARSWAFGLWRYSSGYGTSPLRLSWVTFNVAFWFSVLYFVLDVLAVQFLGQRAFSSYAVVSYLSYFVIGFEGLFPGTAVFLANNFWAQLALAVENGIGAVLVLSLVSLVARRVWRGLG